MAHLVRTLALTSLLVASSQGPASAFYVSCGPNRVSLFHISQYGSFYERLDGSLYYQYFNDVHDKKTVDPRCVGVLRRGNIPLYPQPTGF